MKGRKQFFTFTIFWIFILVLFPYFKKPNVNIKRVLKNRDYSYLPVEAKNYIEKVYEESGEVILTEKNKKENVPYLNPKYIEYLTLSLEEQSQVEEMPEVYRLDYSSEEVSRASLPSSYDIRNVNGKNFITPLKNQSSLDLCWVFTSVEQAESLLLKQKNTSYNSSSPVFSPRQMDYSMSNDGILNYKNDHAVRSIATAGNFFMSSLAMAKGITLASENVMPFDLVTTPKKYSDVLNYENSQYELNSSVVVPTLSNPTSSELSSYVETVKKHVLNYGGAYVGTQSPNASCAAKNTDDKIIIRTDNYCFQNSNHAMQIIGWDDNYSYSYCAKSSGHSAYTSSCSNKVTGKGAWLLRNSWGEDADYAYVYLAYDSFDYDVRATSSLSSMKNRNWDNEYHKEFDNYYILSSSSDSVHFEKKINTPEKLQKVKFYSFGSNGTYTISINSSKENYRRVKTFTVVNPGIYTIDLSDLNIVITDSSFNVEIMSTNGVYFVKKSTMAFTSNVSKAPVIHTDNVFKTSTGTDYRFTLFSDTKNIPSSSPIQYVLYNSSGLDYSHYLTVTNNVVGTNGVNAEVVVSKDIPSGAYVLKTIYNDSSFTSTMVFGGNIPYTGSGTVQDPYLIQNESDLRNMANFLSSHFKLVKDITLTGSWIPIGTKETPFTGSFNGDHHKITNMVVDGDYAYSGLFGYVRGNSFGTTSFKNITFVHPKVDGSENAGIVVGTITGDVVNGTGTVTSNMTFSNIAIIGGHVYSRYAHAGALIGLIDTPINDYHGNHNYTIQNIYNSSSIGGVLSSGIIGHIYGSSISQYAPIVSMENIQNVGILDLSIPRSYGTLFYTGSHGAIVGYILNYTNVTIHNYFVTSSYKEYSVSNDGVVGVSATVSKVTKEKGFSTLDFNVKVDNLRLASTYSTWNDFTTNWMLKKVDNVGRFPIIKNADIPYTKISKIELKPGDVVYLSDYITPKIDAVTHMATGTPTNTSAITVQKVTDARSGTQYDLKITANSDGSSNIPVLIYYDGYEANVNVVVTTPVVENAEIVFYKNDETSGYAYQIVQKNSTFHLRRNTFTRVGYKFRGWNTTSDGKGTAYSDNQSMKADFSFLSLYAQWTPNTYTIHYNGNGGEGSMTSSVVSYNEQIYLKKNTFEYDGYKFNGWNTKQDGSGVSYVDSERISNLSNVDGDEIILYAQWKKQIDGFEILDYSVNYDILYIDDIAIGTTPENYKKHLVLGDGYTITLDLGGKKYINTGSKLKIYYRGELVCEYTNIVRGDINGDGVVNSGDLFRLRQHLLGVSLAEGVYFHAADTNHDNTVNSGDLFRIRQHLLGVLLLL